MNDESWKRSLEIFEIAYLEYAPGARRNLIELFPQVPDKQKAWEELVALTAKMLINEDYRVTSCMPLIFSLAFPLLPNKEKAWLDITKLVDFKESKADKTVKNSMISIFSNSPDKEKAWEDLLRLTRTTNKNSLRTAASILCLNIVSREDKQKAWKVLIQLIKNEETEVKTSFASSINSIFPHVCDSHKAWEDLIELINDKDIQVKRAALNAIASNYSLAPEKQLIWEYLAKFAFDKDSQVRIIASNALVENFPFVPDKQKSWESLIKFTNGDSQVRKIAAGALKSAIPMVNNKEKAWEDLLRLTAHKDIDVRKLVSDALISAYHLVLDKQKLSKDLHKCMKNKDRNVKETIASTLSFIYSQLPDQQQFWEELIELTSDEDIGVRRNAYYSLGKISILKASQAEDEINYRRDFEQAIGFFEKASKESTIYNPSQFCLPFYRSFYTIISDEKQQMKEEVDKYLTEAKNAIKGSENKKILFEAVENLANALKEVQNLKNLDLETKKEELNLYRKYCEQAAELMKGTEKTAPLATATMKRGLPILEIKIKALLYEVQEKAKAVCKQTKGTPAESLGLETNKAAKGLSEYHDYLTLDAVLNERIEDLKSYCGFILPGKKSQFLKMIEETKNMDILKKLESMKKINDYILKSALFPRIENIYISDRVIEYTRIATVQLNYTLSESFPYRLKGEEKEEIKKKILNVLAIAQKEDVKILCLPELCNCEEWLPEIKKFCQNMIVISGTYYDKENHNVCRLVSNLDVEIPSQSKIIPSDFEGSDLIGQRMVPGEKVLNVYETKFGKFSVLICRDFGNFSSNLKGIVDVILCPSYNEANDRFHNIAHIHVTDSPSYIIISNAALYGGTSIFGRMKKGLFNMLEQNGFKEKGDTSYKLCQIEKGKEGMIVADFNLIYKYPPLQTPMNPDEDVIPVTNIRKLIF